MNNRLPRILVRETRPQDFEQIAELGRAVYPEAPPWTPQQLASHRRVFPEGQFVAVEEGTERVMAMAASLIVRWDDYDLMTHWRDFTDNGTFSNHDPARGRTLYGAEIMVRPATQRRGVGSKIYKARRELVERLGLLRIRAGARLRGYHRYAGRMSAQEYVIKVINGELRGPTLGFQLKHGFRVLAVVPGYLRHDPESLGYAAVIEWINARVAQPEDYAGRDPRFQKRSDLEPSALVG
jgi:GNAT superfamily N-acetyltransferase